jgi:hypothetical protein
MQRTYRLRFWFADNEHLRDTDYGKDVKFRKKCDCLALHDEKSRKDLVRGLHNEVQRIKGVKIECIDPLPRIRRFLDTNNIKMGIESILFIWWAYCNGYSVRYYDIEAIDYRGQVFYPNPIDSEIWKWWNNREQVPIKVYDAALEGATWYANNRWESENDSGTISKRGLEQFYTTIKPAEKC